SLWSQPSTSRSLPGTSRSLGIGAGLHPRRGGQFADLAREVEVAFGHGPCVVAGQLDVDVREGQGDIGMVPGLLGGGTDLVDQVESGGEIAGEQSGADGIRPALPVAQSLGIECVEQILSSVCSHDFMLGTGRSSVNPSRGAPVARLPTCPCAVWVRPVGRRAVGGGRPVGRRGVGAPTRFRSSSIKAESRWATVDDSIFAPPLERGQSLRQALNEGSGPADPFSVAAQNRPVVLI